jgi:hypothetical protein
LDPFSRGDKQHNTFVHILTIEIVTYLPCRLFLQINLHIIFMTLLTAALTLLFGLLCSSSLRGGFILGITAAEILTSWWNRRNDSSPPPKIYLFNRRIHHGEIGTLLALFSLSLKVIPIPSAALMILLGMGLGLAKDDYRDITAWFRLAQRENGIRKQNRPGPLKHEDERIWEQLKRRWYDNDTSWIHDHEQPYWRL